MTIQGKTWTSKGSAVQVIICVLLVIALAIYGLSVFMKIMVIEVEGSLTYSAEEVIKASGIDVGHNLLFLNTANAAGNILAAMPFISEVNITRLPPDSLRIEVAESTAIAVISYRSDHLVIDSSSKVLKITGTMPGGLIEIRGVALTDVSEGSLLRSELGSETHLQYMRDVLRAIEREEMQSECSFLDVSNITYINFGYMGRFRVILGGPSNVRHKLGRLPDIIEWVDTTYEAGTAGDINMVDPSGEYSFKPTG